MSARIRLFRRRLRNRDGFAMFMALGALVIIGVLVAASSMISLQETRLGQNSLAQARAFAVAEYGLNRIQADWDRTPNLTMDVGDPPFKDTFDLAGDTAFVHYLRLNNETFWIVSEGIAMVGTNVSVARQGRKRLGAILRLRIPTIKSEGAITANGTIKVSGSTAIDGSNNVPPGWEDKCDASKPAKAGIAIPTTASTADINEKNIISGSPKILKSATAGSASTYVSFGDENWNSLAGLANLKYLNGVLPDAGPRVSGGACDRAHQSNWGEPWRAGEDNVPNNPNPALTPLCENYFPIIFATCPAPWPTPPATCTISFNGGRGQGIMLIYGDLFINGNLDWYGLIVVSGDIKKGNGSPVIYGSVMSANSDMDLENSAFTGSSTFNYSQCSLERAMRGTALVLQARERSWTELY
jgi:hypothetical protein